MASGHLDKTLLNVIAITCLIVIILAMGIFVSKTLTMNMSGDARYAIEPSISHGDDSYVITFPSTSPALSPAQLPLVSPSPSINRVAATLTFTPTPVITSTPSPTPTPLPAPSPTPIQAVDMPFYESITPLKEKDQFSLAPVHNSYIAGNGPLYLDLVNSYMGSGYAYAGDTIGVKLRIKNKGPTMNKTAFVTMNISRMVYTPYESYWSDDIINGQFNTQIVADENAFFTKNISYTVPDMPSIKGFYRIYVRFYVDDKFNAGFIKELNILEP